MRVWCGGEEKPGKIIQRPKNKQIYITKRGVIPTLSESSGRARNEADRLCACLAKTREMGEREREGQRGRDREGGRK